LKKRKKGYPDEGDTEGFAEYYSDLLGVVGSFVDWNDPRQACILADAGSSDDSAFAAEIADHAKVTIPCLMKRSESAISMNRAVAVPVLVQALRKVQGAPDSGTAQSARQIIVAALHDRDEAVRSFTVHALGKFGASDMIPALKEVAANDPTPEVQGHSIRKSAADAIAEIQQRAGQH
jgi:HEAT repeats